MWCAERVQRLIMAIVLCLVLYLLTAGTPTMGLLGIILGGLMAFMLVIWFLFDFCPMVSLLKKFLPSCCSKES